MRAAIFRLHLRKRDAGAGFDVSRLAGKSEGFSGAEIEQAIVSALFAARAARRALTQDDLLTELRNTRPLSVLMAEQVQGLREWAQGRTVSAD